MNLTGGIEVTLKRSGDGYAVELVSRRPVDLARLFAAKSPEELHSSLPRLFSLCGVAQARAVQRACAELIGLEAPVQLEQARDRLVMAEMLREHALRVLMGWNKAAGAPLSSAAARQLTGLVGVIKKAHFGTGDPFAGDVRLAEDKAAVRASVEVVSACLEREVFGEPLDVFIDRSDVTSLKRWASGWTTPAAVVVDNVIARGWAVEGASEVAPLAADDVARLAIEMEKVTAGNFVAEPQMDGVPRETSALTRQANTLLVSDIVSHFGRGLLARLAARLVELAALPGRLIAQEPIDGFEITGSVKELPANTSFAMVETARGRLVHYVKMAGSQIADMHVLAPTEWNFHPQGAAAQALSNLAPAGDEELLRKAGLLIETIDPCVGYDLRLGHA